MATPKNKIQSYPPIFIKRQLTRIAGKHSMELKDYIKELYRLDVMADANGIDIFQIMYHMKDIKELILEKIGKGESDVTN